MNSSGLGQRTVRPHAGGLPGAQVNEENVAPADRAASDMGPTEALFDAVDRGDAVAARGAINRGADMRARSVFGFTPVELAVDLGRKDIAFLLLSMRGMDGRAELQPNRQTAAPNAAQQARQAVARVAPTTGPMAPHGPRLFAGDGGAAQPEVGFLGFGGGVDGGARPRAR
ncbi:MAG: ankyrin repeat domain-containing protein [Acetobacteraceae bacterium]|nr:ankyrin repeat domain-containing protein [Acetobacteraceae bacterium]